MMESHQATVTVWSLGKEKEKKEGNLGRSEHF